ncbi:MAG: NERD domain-containing protein [Gammaproteobacteria bacterium]|nr:NERD domain-containing protein [Gammaproteobacteria bacterium]
MGEAAVRRVAEAGLPEPFYHSVHDVTLPTPDGTTQIDLIIVSRFGVFVVETKMLSGWIFGDAYQKQWTQVLFRTKTRFQNPIHQNFKHVKALEALLLLPPETIHSVVVFTGSGEFKTPMPANVLRSGSLQTYIKSFTQVVLSEDQVQNALLQIQTQRLPVSWETQRQHIRHLRSRADPTAERKCPKCGSPMVIRTARRGVGAGKQFWGCSAYPKCRMIQDIG